MRTLKHPQDHGCGFGGVFVASWSRIEFVNCVLNHLKPPFCVGFGVLSMWDMPINRLDMILPVLLDRMIITPF